MFQWFLIHIFFISIGTPTRNEKFLSCVAAGKWVLHKSYLDDAQAAGRFPPVSYD
jgi:hypothetical protein